MPEQPQEARSAATPSQRFTKGGAECRETHVKGYTGPICSCPPLQCGASLGESANQRFNPTPLTGTIASGKDETDDRLRELEEQHEKNMRILGLIRDDHGWALSRILLAERLEEAVWHVIADSPGTPETVKGYLRTALRGF